MVKRHYKVIWDDEAKASLRRIYNYIKKRESKEQAARVRSEIKKEGDSLGFIPHKYASDPFMEKDPRDIHSPPNWCFASLALFAAHCKAPQADTAIKYFMKSCKPSAQLLPAI